MEQQPMTPPSEDELVTYSLGKCDSRRALEIEAFLTNGPDCSSILEGVPDDPLVTHLRGAGELPRVAPVTASPKGAADAPSQVGQDLAGFRLLRLLGEGGMGRVYEAEEIALRRRVAVKVMHPHLAARTSGRERFLREARAAAAVHHDHIVPVFQVGEGGEVPFLVMPLLEGETLEKRLHRVGLLPVAEALRIARETAEGLAAAHARGLIHRDVKPANLWLEASSSSLQAPVAASIGGGPPLEGGRVKVLDFGLARAVDDGDRLTQTGVVCGTLGYMAPEQAERQDVDERADVFSLGCVLYRMLTGKPAFEGRSLPALLRAVAEQTPAPPSALEPTIPPVLSDLVLRMLAKDREERPPSAKAVADELAAIEAELLSGTLRTRRTSPQATWPRSREDIPRSPATPVANGTGKPRRRWLLAAVAVLPLVVLGGWLLFRGGSQPLPTGADPTPVNFKGSVDLLVQRMSEDGAEIAVPLSDPLAMPLQPGDYFKITCEVDPPAYLYLFWVDETGTCKPTYPWNPFKGDGWGSRPAEEKPVPRVEIKDSDGIRWLQVSGDTAGMETVLMLACRTRLDRSDEEIRGWFHGLKPLPFKGPRTRVWFENFDLVRNDVERGYSYVGDLLNSESPLGLQQVLGHRIGKDANYSRAISFARLGKKEGK